MEEDPDALAREPRAFVIIEEVPDGTWGVFGRALRYSDMVSLVAADVQAAAGAASGQRIAGEVLPKSDPR